MKLYELGKMETAKVVKMDCGEEYNERFKNYGFSEDSVFTVVDKTVISVKAPVLDVTKINIEDGLPVLRGSTTGGVYRWKEGQTATVGTKTYEWEFVPTSKDPTVEYKDVSGTIELTFVQADSGCGANIINQPFSFIVLAGLTLTVIIKNKIKKDKGETL